MKKSEAVIPLCGWWTLSPIDSPTPPSAPGMSEPIIHGMTNWASWSESMQ